MQVANTTAEKLNGLLRDENSAVETYRQALEKIESAGIRADLEKCQSCHASRAAALSSQIAGMGVEPAKDSGVWGAFAKLMQEGAKLFGDKAGVAVLEEGEDHALRDYRKLVEEPDEVIQSTLRELLPKQEGTHEIMATLKHSLN